MAGDDDNAGGSVNSPHSAEPSTTPAGVQLVQMAMPAAVNVSPPAPLDVEKPDIEDAWEAFISEFEIYAQMIRLDQQDEQFQKANLLFCLGKDARDWLRQKAIDAKTLTYEQTIDAISEKCKAASTPALRDYKFFHAETSQRAGESFDAYHERVRRAAVRCSFESVSGNESITDRLIKSRLITGLSDSTLQKELMGKSYTLENVVKKAQAFEMGRRGAAEMQAASKSQATSNHQSDVVVAKVDRDRAGKRSQGDSGGKIKCYACGHNGHIARQCPEKKTRDGKSSGNSHGKRSSGRSSKRVYIVNAEQETTDTDSDSESFTIGSVQQLSLREAKARQHTSKEKWQEVVRIFSASVCVKIDTGAEVSVLPRCLVDELVRGCKNVTMERSTVRLVSYFGEKHSSTHVVSLPVSHRAIRVQERFYVVDAKVVPTLSGDAAEALGLIKRVNTVTSDGGEAENWKAKYAEVFTGVGNIKGFQCRLRLKKQYTPVLCPSRPVPSAYQQLVRKEINRMLKKGVIVPLRDEPTEFLSNIVTVPKSGGRVRVCLDPTHLNKALERGPHPMKRLEQIAANLHGAKWFSALDADEGFWQLSLDRDSSYLCSFITPWGRFRFTKMPFGLVTASDEFQRMTDQLFGSIEGATVVVDDILVWGSTKEQHDQRLQAVLERCREVGMVLNASKCRLAQSSVRYLGHIFSQQGMAIDPGRIRDIMEVPSPTSAKDVQHFLGMVNFVGQFVDHLSDRSAILRELVKKDVLFHWLPHHEKAFKELKEALCRAPVLAFYDPKKEVVLSVDASKKGVGAVLLQEGRPIAYSSKSLTDSQERWAQIEKELLAIVHGCAKFHFFIYGGQSVRVESDHKPLQAIFTKPLNQVPLRLQQMRMTLQRYDIQVVYRPGSELVIADYLSRHPGKEEVDFHFTVAGIGCVAIQDHRLAEYQAATSGDAELRVLGELYQEGWPSDKRKVPECARKYWAYRDEIHAEQGLILRSNRLMVPTSKKHEVMGQLHAAHCGQEKMKNRARSTVYWHGMTVDIENFVKSCSECQQNRPANQKEPMVISEIPSLPWETVSVDLFEFDGRQFQIVVDHFSFWWEITPMKGLLARHAVRALFSVLSAHGLPMTIKSDQGPQYGEEFSTVLKQHGIKHVRSSPRYAQSNGMVERAVQEAKKILKKTSYGSSEYFVALMEWRSTPRSKDLAAPSQRAMSRLLRTTVPVLAKNLRPRVVSPERTKAALLRERMTQKQYYDRTARARPDLSKGQRVRVLSHVDGKWYPGTVLQVLKQPRSYLVQNHHGKALQRNKTHIRESSTALETPTTSSPESFVTPPESSREVRVDRSQEPPVTPVLRRSERCRKPNSKYCDKAS